MIAPQDDKLWRMRAGWKALLLLGVAAGQLVIWLQSSYLPLAQNLRAVREWPAVERSLRLSFSSELTSYMLFLRANIPEDGTTLLPPTETHPVLGHSGIMQYLLFPRRVTNCPGNPSSDECRELVRTPHLSVLAVGSFPALEMTTTEKRLLQHGTGMGLWLPAPIPGEE